MKLPALFLAGMISCAASIGGYWIGRNDQAIVDVEHPPAPFSLVDATIEAFSDWAGHDSRAALLDVRKDIIMFLAGNSMFILNASFYGENACPLTIQPLYVPVPGGVLDNLFIDCSKKWKENSDAAMQDFDRKLKKLEKEHPMSAKEKQDMLNSCASDRIGGTGINVTIEGHDFAYLDCP